MAKRLTIVGVMLAVPQLVLVLWTFASWVWRWQGATSELVRLMTKHEKRHFVMNFTIQFLFLGQNPYLLICMSKDIRKAIGKCCKDVKKAFKKCVKLITCSST